MNPSTPDHFSWKQVFTDPERFAQNFDIDLGAQHGGPGSSYSTESQYPSNREHLPYSDHDTLNHSARQEHADYVSPSTQEYSPAFAPPQYPEHGDFFDHYSHLGSFPSNPNFKTPTSAEVDSSQNYGQYSDLSYSHESPDSFDFSPLYGTPSSAEHSTSQQVGYSDHPSYPHASIGSFDSPPRYAASASAEVDASQQYVHNDYQNYRDAALASSANPLYETSAFAEPSSSQRYDQSSAAYDLTEDQGYRIPAQIPDNSLSPNHAYEPAQISHSQDVDRARLQDIQASLAIPFPRFLAPGFNPSILSQCFKTFSRVRKETILRSEVLGKQGNDLNKFTISKIFNAKRGNATLIEKFNTVVTRIGVGKIETLIPKTHFRFIKGENFHFVDIFCEAHSKILQDCRVKEIPNIYLQFIAMLYGNRAFTCQDFSHMLDLTEDTVNDAIRHCNYYLAERRSPVKIGTFKSKQVRYFHLALVNSENIE